MVTRLNFLLRHSLHTSMKRLEHLRNQNPYLLYYSEPATPLREIRPELEKYHGGEVNLFMDNDTGIALFLLNHPEKRNAISGRMMVEMADAVQSLESWNMGKGVLVYGAGRTFCSGGDLDFAKATSNPDSGYKMSLYMTDVLTRLKKLPLVTVCLIDGAGALGGGAEIAVSCDFRLITDDASGIGFVHGKMGIVPAWGGGSQLVSLIGKEKALEVLLNGNVLSPKEAKEIGLVTEVISPSSEGLNLAIAWLKKKTEFSHQVINACKLIVTNDGELEESRVFAPLWGGEENKKALLKKIKHKQ